MVEFGLICSGDVLGTIYELLYFSDILLRVVFGNQYVKNCVFLFDYISVKWREDLIRFSFKHLKSLQFLFALIKKTDLKYLLLLHNVFLTNSRDIGNVLSVLCSGKAPCFPGTCSYPSTCSCFKGFTDSNRGCLGCKLNAVFSNFILHVTWDPLFNMSFSDWNHTEFQYKFISS